MKRALVWLLLGYFCLILQAAVMPLFLSLPWRPDLLLLVLLSVSLIEPMVPGVFLACLLGAFQDVYTGATFGLYAFVNPLFYLLVRSVVGQLNYDSPWLFPVLSILGTVLQSTLIAFCLWTFADVGSLWQVVWPRIVPVVISTFLISLLVSGIVMPIVRGRKLDEA